MKRYYALFSGGLDSTLAILLAISGKDVIRLTPVFFQYGQKSQAEEIKAIHRLIPLLRNHLGSPSSVLDDCREFDITRLFSWSNSPVLQRSLTNEGPPDVENRNMVLIGCAASVIMSDWKHPNTESTKLIVGFKNEHYDTKRQFVSAINRAFEAMSKPISLVAPLISEGQNEHSAPERLAKYAHSLGVLGLLEESWSCYYPTNGEPCSRCRACQGRADFFAELRVRAREKGHM